MKKNGILNSNISRVLGYLAHTDQLCISDCGLPIPDEVERIDLALKPGLPSFLQVLEEVLKDMKVEKIFLAEEIKQSSPGMLKDIERYFETFETGFEIEFLPHSELKKQTSDCKAVIRTGEQTPYANIILQSGCIF